MYNTYTLAQLTNVDLLILLLDQSAMSTGVNKVAQLSVIQRKSFYVINLRKGYVCHII